MYPDKPNIPIYAGTAAHRDQQQENYKAAMVAFLEVKELQNKLRKLIIQAVPDVYIAKLRHPLVRYANTHPQDMLAHLVRQYGTITPVDLAANMEHIQAPWNPNTSIEHVITRGTNCPHFANEGGNPINDAAYLRILLTVLRQSGIMDDDIKIWAMKETQAQTLDNAFIHFTRASEFQQETRAYLKDTMTAHQAIKAQPSAGPPARPLPTTHPLHGYSYCWPHGVCTHAGAQCRTPATGHIPTATLRNPEGGFIKVYQPNAQGGRGINRGRGAGGRTQARAIKRKVEDEATETQQEGSLAQPAQHWLTYMSVR
jgi:hypothetical protein